MREHVRREPTIGSRPTKHNAEGDRGSVTPLIIGMVLILLVLGLGVAAAGSVFVGRQRLQNLCDGAASAAGDAIGPNATDGQPTDAAVAAADGYLAIRAPDVGVAMTISGGSAHLQCETDQPISFGGLFTISHWHFVVTASSEPALDAATNHAAIPLAPSEIWATRTTTFSPWS